jgi:hypothetical protein
VCDEKGGQQPACMSRKVPLAVLRGVTRFCGIALRGLVRLPIEEHALFVYTPGIARKRPIIADDTVTGNRHSKVIGGASACHSADRFGRTNAAGDLCIRDGLARRNLLQGSPDPLLKGGAANVERQVKTNAGRFYEAHDPRH